MAKKPKKSAVQQQRERIYKGLRSWLIPPDLQPVINITVAPSRHGATNARQRHAQLVAARIGADPRLV
jgi:hypothetical protein